MTLDTNVHHALLIRILRDIYINESINTLLGFKEGTAAYLFYHLVRFSVDLDFDLLDKTHIDLIFDSIEKIIENYGKIKQARKKRFNIFFLLSYNNKMANAYNIKIEINLRDFGSKYEEHTYLGIPMLVMVREDMAAHKLVAMSERIGKANRDIFDVWFFLKNNWPINKTIIEQRTGVSMDLFLHQCIDLLEAMSDQGILSGLGELLNQKQKAWARIHMRKETIFLLKMKLRSLKQETLTMSA